MAFITLESWETVGIGGGHLYLVFTDDDGTERVIRGGPNTQNGDPGVFIAGLTSLVGQIDILLSESHDARKNDFGPRTSIVLDLDGRDPHRVWELMVQHANNNLDSAGYFDNFRYFLATQNSNSFVASVLNAVGFEHFDTIYSFSSNWAFPGVLNLLHKDYIFQGTADDDIIHGYTGDDRFVASAGDDILSGRSVRGTEGASDGRDTASYTVSPGAISVEIHALANFASPNLTTPLQSFVTVTNDGFGGTDQLFSIEQILGTKKNDRLQVVDWVPTEVEKLTISAGRGKDVVDLDSTSTGFVVNLADINNQWVRQTDGSGIEGFGPKLHLQSFNDVEGESLGDFIYTNDSVASVRETDPLVLDLDGDGIELLPYSVFSPFLISMAGR